MGRYIADCRGFPSEPGCTLAIWDEEAVIVTADHPALETAMRTRLICGPGSKTTSRRSLGRIGRAHQPGMSDEGAQKL